MIPLKEKLKIDREKLAEETKQIQKEVSKQTIGYIVAALSLVAGLAWNEAIKALIEYIYPLDEDTLQAKFIYAITITLIIAFVAGYLVRFTKDEEKK